MRSVDLNGTAVQWVNATEMRPGDQGIIPARFPAATLADFGDMAPIARMATGIELQIHGQHITNLEIQLRVLDSDGYGTSAELFRGPHKLLPTWTLRHDTCDVQSRQFAMESPHSSHYPLRFLLPTHCVLEIVGVAVNDDAALMADFPPFDYRALPHASGQRWLVHGDSLVQGANVSVPSCTWVDLTARMLGLRPINLGIGGYGRAELPIAHYLAARQDYDLLSVHLGVNCIHDDSDSAFASRFRAFLDIIRATHPETPLLVGTPIYAFTDLDGSPKLQAIRDTMSDVCTERQRAGDARLYLIDGLSLIDNPESLRADLLHLDDFGAMQYTLALLPHMRRVLELAIPSGAAGTPPCHA